MANVYNDAARVDFKAKVSAYFNGSYDVIDYIKSLELNHDRDADKKTFKEVKHDFMNMGVAIYLLKHDKTVNQENVDARVKNARETAKASRTPIDHAAVNATTVKWFGVMKELGLTKQRQNSPATPGSKGTDKGADAPAPAATIKASDVKSFDDLLKASEAIASFLAEMVKAGMTIKPSHGLALGLDRTRQCLKNEINAAMAEALAEMDNAKVMAEKAEAKAKAKAEADKANAKRLAAKVKAIREGAEADDAKVKATKAKATKAKGKPSLADEAIREGAQAALAALAEEGAKVAAI